MKLPTIKTFYKINKRYNPNESDKNTNSQIFPEDNSNNNKINSSNNIFLYKFYSTKYTLHRINSLKLSNSFETKQNSFKLEIKKEDNDNDLSQKKINSYRYISLPDKYNKLKYINNIIKYKDKNTLNKINKKIKLIKSVDNLLYLNNNFNTNNKTNNTNQINLLFTNKSLININELIGNKNSKSLKNIKNEKDEDKTILPFSSKILNQNKVNHYNLNIKGIKYSDFTNESKEINKDLIKKKTLDYKIDNKKYHEHHIIFNYSFIKNYRWNNKLLKIYYLRILN